MQPKDVTISKNGNIYTCIANINGNARMTQFRTRNITDDCANIYALDGTYVCAMWAGDSNVKLAKALFGC